ncbi:unnamed protein product [Trichogramma brassicae]|uniref:Uncharacterized protein n=1 Tax=Trichogramma brassicae TaxID=86971 RepID=A0A6H5J8B0_9HYME|nr:unnamed protein product [Trichogramma brassicae]
MGPKGILVLSGSTHDSPLVYFTSPRHGNIVSTSHSSHGSSVCMRIQLRNIFSTREQKTEPAHLYDARAMLLVVGAVLLCLHQQSSRDSLRAQKEHFLPTLRMTSTMYNDECVAEFEKFFQSKRYTFIEGCMDGYIVASGVRYTQRSNNTKSGAHSSINVCFKSNNPLPPASAQCPLFTSINCVTSSSALITAPRLEEFIRARAKMCSYIYVYAPSLEPREQSQCCMVTIFSGLRSVYRYMFWTGSSPLQSPRRRWSRVSSVLLVVAGRSRLHSLSDQSRFNEARSGRYLIAGGHTWLVGAGAAPPSGHWFTVSCARGGRHIYETCSPGALPWTTPSGVVLVMCSPSHMLPGRRTGVDSLCGAHASGTVYLPASPTSKAPLLSRLPSRGTSSTRWVKRAFNERRRVQLSIIDRCRGYCIYLNPAQYERNRRFGHLVHALGRAAGGAKLPSVGLCLNAS